MTSTSTGKGTHYARLRERLQQKGRRFAKRRMRRIEQRERRLKAQANHGIAKQIITQHPHALIGLENLTDIRERTKRKRMKNGKGAERVSPKARHAPIQRRDFHHKQAKSLVQKHQTIVFEALEITNISKRAKPKQNEHGTYLPNGAAAKSGLNKSILDAGWGQFQHFVLHKAACAGRTVLFVSPKYTSQICSQCGTVRKKSLEERWHSCECGCELDRDTNAAINILWAGRVQHGVAPCVEARL